MPTVKAYYRLAKPGIVYGNGLSTLAGFLYASRWHFSPQLFLGTLLGIGLVIGSAAVTNNILDRDIDRKMERTQKRQLVRGDISVTSAIFYATILGAIGFATLFLFTNLLATLLAAIGFISYAFVYSFAKRLTPSAALIGTVPGAIPLIVGYVAATNRLDLAALILFLTMIAWQMPHFYALSIYRAREYAAADLPIWPVKKGILSTKIQIVFYAFLFLIFSASLTLFGYAGYAYVIIMLAISLYWLYLSSKGFKAINQEKWARKTFRMSLITLLIYCITLSVASILP